MTSAVVAAEERRAARERLDSLLDAADRLLADVERASRVAPVYTPQRLGGAR